MKKILFLFVIIATAILIETPIAHATIIDLEFDIEFSGATPPEGPTPWLTATIDNESGPGVTLSLVADGLTDDEFVSAWFFNVDPLLDPLYVAYPDWPAVTNRFTTDTTDASWSSLAHSSDSSKADGDNGLYDFRFNFHTSGDGRLTVGEEFSVTFYYPGLTASDFLFGNEGSDKGGPFIMAAHVQGVGPKDANSGWVAAKGITVPEPATMLLLGTGLLGFAVIRRRFKK